MTMTHAQAVDRVSGLINDTVAVLTPRPRLEIDAGLSGDNTCETALGNSKLVTTGKTYLFQGIPVSDHAAIGSQVLAYWQKEGYSITQTDGLGTDQPNIDAQTTDGFHVWVESGGDGLLTIGAVSPCVQP